MAEWDAPGVVVITARQGEEARIHYYGSRLPDSVAAITGQTLLPIASNSKAVTGLMMSLLVSEGRLEWDDPVLEYLPEYSVPDAEAKAETTIGDLMTHQAGLPPGDCWWLLPT